MIKEALQKTIMNIRPLTIREFSIMAVLCVITIGIASYDFYTLKLTQQHCLNDCNNHWVNEFKTKCMGIYGQPEEAQGLVYHYNFSLET